MTSDKDAAPGPPADWHEEWLLRHAEFFAAGAVPRSRSRPNFSDMPPGRWDRFMDEAEDAELHERLKEQEDRLRG